MYSAVQIIIIIIIIIIYIANPLTIKKKTLY